ncbi:hypothetical protein Pth03_78020 [Planotetraspora thailandica]|uniref:Uncharacterized protein n=1 Tax=Planotetraspora thailandica TaxID=487172 RepID=A0A8J4DEZ4_9ACTN|nr:hypothetical protein [Planotetraspora thailandica]GII59413.1 hypothetical protein Pth03_78020 [Planotetraspora thailandica]
MPKGQPTERRKTVTTVTHVKPHSNWGPGKEPQSVRDAYDAQLKAQGKSGGDK